MIFSDHTHPNAFDTLEKVTLHNKKYYPEDQYKECFVCQGHGKYVYNHMPGGHAYRYHGDNSCIDGKCKGPHHDVCECGQCGGSGFVRKSTTCMHEWKYDSLLGNCHHRYRCSKCNNTKDVDSSD